MNIQIHHQSLCGTFEDDNGLQKGVCEAQRQKQTKMQIGSIQQPSSDKITPEDRHSMETAADTKGESSSLVQDQKQYPEKNLKIIPFTANEQALAQARLTCRIDSPDERHLLPSSFHGTSQLNNLSEDLENQIPKSLASGANLQPDKSHAKKQRRPPGKT